ncbi:hypothetical protein BOX15_Mlig015059g2 [Macrostomum lignano]|uniref:UspA domain-containing protein n=1 Tax=Macrostomum lignano TaxID=282301 RepID=A0A267GKC7_9PLAT|nr:hypothetical protein BOX15_Mlig015059g2 [Macrostomum lignano]
MASPQQPTVFLLAYDNSENSQAALSWFARLNAERDTRHQLVIFYSVEAPPLPRGNTTLKMSKTELYTQLMQESSAQIDRVRKRCLALCQQLGLPADSVKFIDKYEAEPGKAIVAMATELDAAAILMGTRGLKRLQRTMLGSVSDYVVHHAHRPVIVVPLTHTNG